VREREKESMRESGNEWNIGGITGIKNDETIKITKKGNACHKKLS
jgi:hypothetical protein